MLRKLSRAVAQLEAADREHAEHVQDLLETVRERCQHVGVREFAAQAGVDAAISTRVLDGRRKSSHAMLAKLETLLAQEAIHINPHRNSSSCTYRLKADSDDTANKPL
jgi:hypothetical protein